MEKKDKEISKIMTDTNHLINTCHLSLVDIVVSLNPKIEEKLNHYKEQTDIKNRSSNQNQSTTSISELENKLLKSISEKEFIIKQNDEEKKILLDRISRLEQENKIMTEKVIKKAKDLINSSEIGTGNINTMENPNDRSQIGLLNRSNVIFNSPTSVENINTSLYLNKSKVLVGPIGSRVLTKKMLLEIINDIYTSKIHFDKKCEESRMPKETMEQHMYTWLNQKYGLKNLIIEWATSIINGIRVFSPEESEICLFGKILRNELEEESRFVIAKLKSTISELLEYFLKAKFPLKSSSDILQICQSRKNSFLNEDEWKGIIYSLFEKRDSMNLENRIVDFVKKKYIDPVQNKQTEVNKKLTREELKSLSNQDSELKIAFSEFVKMVLDFQIRSRDRYLKNFCYLFKKQDKDNNGIINEEEFINLLSSFGIYNKSNSYFNENADKLLNIIDPFNNSQITFSECVNLFSMQQIIEIDQKTGKQIEVNVLDRISEDESILNL
jgi:hypothetical protein